MTKLLLALVLALVPGVASASDLTTTADTRPPGCSHHFKDPNPRQRTIIRDTNMHEMSNPPVGAPHGP